MSTTSREVPTTRTIDRRNRCINCFYAILRNQRRYSLEQATTQMINVLQSWITPTQLSPGSIICSECFELLQNRANTMSEGSAMPLPALGHRRICFPCGSSILRAPRTYPVRHDRQERTILMRLVPLHLVSRMERVCAACWRSATREVQRQQQHDSNRPTVAHVVSSDDFNVPEPPPLPSSRPVAVQLADVETEQPISSGNTSPYQQCNAQVTHAEKIQEDVTKAFIAKVFHYLEHEFEVLKKMDAEMILSNLSKLLYRTAMATGVSETTVLEILQEEARRSAGTQESGSQGELQVPVEFTGQPRKPTRKRRRVYKKQNLDESSSEASDGSIEEVASSSIAQDTTIEPDGELMVMKAEPFEYYNEEPAINIQPVNPTAVNKEQTQIDPISLDVKEESADDDELNDCIETLARQSASSRRTYGKRDVISTHGQDQMDPVSSDVKMEQPDGQTRRQEDYCTPGTSRSHRPVIELDGRCLLRVGAVKEESENEEGFS